MFLWWKGYEKVTGYYYNPNHNNYFMQPLQAIYTWIGAGEDTRTMAGMIMTDGKT